MAQIGAAGSTPRRYQLQASMIVLAVATACAVPILPLKQMGIDVSGITQWAGQFNPQHSENQPFVTAPDDSASADSVRLLEASAKQLAEQIEKNPTDPSLHNRLGLVYLSLADINAAESHFDKAVSLGRQGISTLNDQIAELRQNGRIQDATTALLESSRLNVELLAAHSNLARLYEKRGQHDKVITQLDLLNKEGALFDNAAAPPCPGNGSRQGMLRPKVARDLAYAEALFQTQKYPQAIAAYKKVLSEDPTVAMAHHRLGAILCMSNQTASGIEELEIAAKQDPASAEIQNALGQARQAMGMDDQAMRAYQCALALEPRMSQAALNLSNLYSARGRVADAIGVLTQAVKDNPDCAAAHNNLGTLLALEGQDLLALSEFQKTVALAPNLASAHYGLGNCLMKTRSYMPAVQEYKKALALQPTLTAAQAKMDQAYRKASMTVGSAQALN